MTQLSEQSSGDTGVEQTDLGAEIRRVLEASSEPLTLSKIRSALPARLRSITLEALAESLRRQVAANVVIQYPKYRSQQDRFWDRPMPVHVASLVRGILEQSPLALSDLRRKLPAYALPHAEAVIQEQTTQGLLYRLPKAAGRGKERLSVSPPDPKEYLRSELVTVFGRLEQLGFTQAQLRAGALELLHEEEWASPPAEEQGASRHEAGPNDSDRLQGNEEPAPEPAFAHGDRNPS
jgi:hypothetical protein